MQVLGASDGFIQLGRNTGIPVPDSYGGRAGAARGRRSGTLQPIPDDDDNLSYSSGDEGSVAMSAATVARRKGETAEEKKARKGAVKEAKASLRIMSSVIQCPSERELDERELESLLFVRQ